MYPSYNWQTPRKNIEEAGIIIICLKLFPRSAISADALLLKDTLGLDVGLRCKKMYLVIKESHWHLLRVKLLWMYLVFCLYQADYTWDTCVSWIPTYINMQPTIFSLPFLWSLFCVRRDVLVVPTLCLGCLWSTEAQAASKGSKTKQLTVKHPSVVLLCFAEGCYNKGAKFKAGWVVSFFPASCDRSWQQDANGSGTCWLQSCLPLDGC